MGPRALRVREQWGVLYKADEGTVGGRHRLLQAVWQPRVSLEARRASLTLSLRDHPQVAVRLHAHKRLVRAPTLPLSPALLRRALPPSLGVTLGFVAGGGTRGGCGTCGVRSGCHLCVRAACGASSLPDCAHKNVVHPHTTPSTCRSTAGRVQRCPPGGSVLRGAHPP